MREIAALSIPQPRPCRIVYNFVRFTDFAAVYFASKTFANLIFALFDTNKRIDEIGRPLPQQSEKEAAHLLLPVARIRMKPRNTR